MVDMQGECNMQYLLTKVARHMSKYIDGLDVGVSKCYRTLLLMQFQPLTITTYCIFDLPHFQLKVI